MFCGTAALGAFDAGSVHQAAAARSSDPGQRSLLDVNLVATELLCGDQLLLERSTGVSKLAGVIYHSLPGAHPKLVCQGSITWQFRLLSHHQRSLHTPAYSGFCTSLNQGGSNSCLAESDRLCHSHKVGFSRGG
ncbi:hypothetical protein ABBQ32_008609 [Trebouxia sp. C0010 RCD-2024]